MSGLGLGVFALVLCAHVGLATLLITQTLTISSSEQDSTASGPLRVRLVSSRPEPVVVPPVVPPPVVPPPQPKPKPEKKVLSSETPSQRTVEAPKSKPDPTPPPQPVAQPNPAPVPPSAPVAPAPSPTLPTGKPEMQTVGSTPKEVSQIDCRVPKPEYPRSARRRNEAGTVSIRLTVDEHGQVSAAIDRSSGFPDLDASARQAAQAAQCKPYLEAGRPIRATALQPFNFVPTD